MEKMKNAVKKMNNKNVSGLNKNYIYHTAATIMILVTLDQPGQAIYENSEGV